MTEDITFCQNGWEECLVTRCERHPSNIENPQIPHSYAKLYRTEYCPLEKPQPIDVVETPSEAIKALSDVPDTNVGDIVRCKDCKHLFEDNKCPLRTWWTHTEDDFCSYAERREEHD